MKNMLLVAIAFAAIAAVGTVIALSSPSQVLTQSESTSAISGGFASITTEQSDNKIVITIERDPSAPGSGGEIPAVPEGPIIIVPDPSGEGNGTVIVPPVDNQTAAEGNETGTVEPPVIVIDPDGNATEVQPPSNVTVIDNGTVIVAPPNQTITETPGNVTVIDPPPVAPAAGNATEPCACPPSAPADAITPPAAGDNETIVIESPPAPAQLPADTSNGDGDGDGNGDGDEGG
jgi:hypothetical protein